MVSIPKVIGLMSCGFVLCVGLSTAAQAGNQPSAADETNAGQSDRRQGDQAGDKKMSDEMLAGHSEGGKTIKGEVLRVEGENYFIKGKDGKEVRLHTDKTTQKIGEIKQGDRIEVKVNDQNHALSMRSARGTEAGQGNEGVHDSLGEKTDADRPTDPSLGSSKNDSMGQK